MKSAAKRALFLDGAFTRLLWLMPLAVVVFLRDPRLFRAPRFWAEEGTHYFQAALGRSFFDGLMNLEAAPHNPYLHPIPHLSGLAAAHWVPLEWAPAVTTAAWAATVLALALIVLYAKTDLLEPAWRRVLALAVPVLAVSNSENWVSTLGAHFYLDIGLLLLLLEAPNIAGRRRIASVAVFAVLALLSPTSWLLVPGAALLARRDFKAHRAHVTALGAAVVVHVAISLLAFSTLGRARSELAALPHLLLSKTLLWPLAGHALADGYASFALGLDRAAFSRLGWLIAAGIASAYAALFAWKRRDAATIAIAATHLTATAGFLLLGIGINRELLPLVHGGRYAWLPNALLLLLLGRLLDVPRLRARDPAQLALALLFAAALLVGMLEYRFPDSVVEWARAPSWQREVERYREDRGYDRLSIAPVGWTVQVPRLELPPQEAAPDDI